MWFKKTITTLPVALGFCLLQTPEALAELSPTEQKLESAIEKLSAQTEALQNEVQMLKGELKAVKRQKRLAEQKAQTKTQRVYRSTVHEDCSKGYCVTKASPALRKRGIHYQTVPVKLAKTRTFGNETFADDPATAENTWGGEKYGNPMVPLMGTPVVTSPIVNLRSRYDASDLIVNFSTMNEDVRLLNLRDVMEQALCQEDLPFNYRPFAILSGKVEGQFMSQRNYSETTNNGIDLSGVELDVTALAGPWALGFISIGYNNAPLDPQLLGSGNSVNNSNLFVNRGFLTLGNLSRFPLYLTMGQLYEPFGDYSTFIITNPVTKVLGRVNARSIVGGFSKDGLYFAGYLYDAATTTSSNGNSIEDGGLNAGYKFSNDAWNINFGAGVINNMGDAQGIQTVDNPSGFFQGFGADASTERLVTRAPGFDAHFSIGSGPLTFLTEYVSTLSPYNVNDLAFNGEGAAPKAAHAEAVYSWKTCDKPMSLAFTYEQTWQALALNLPKNSYIATLSASIWKNTIESLEFRHDVNYAVTDTAGGICDPNLNGNPTFCPVPQAGGQQNTLIAQIGVYF